MENPEAILRPLSLAEEAQATLQLEGRIADMKEAGLTNKRKGQAVSYRPQQVGEILELNRSHRRRGGIYEDSSHTGSITGVE